MILSRTQTNGLLGKQLSRNFFFSGGQAVVGMISMFWAYRVLLHAAGTELMGLWSLLMAGTTLARVVDVTGAGGLARFVAEARVQGQNAVIYVHTVTITTLILYALLGVLAYLASDVLTARFVHQRWVDDAHKLMPLAIATGLFAMPLAATLVSGVDGLHRADLRAMLVMASYLVFLVIVLLAVPHFGAWAWGAAVLVQQVLLVIGAWTILARNLPGLGPAPWRCSRAVFATTFAYGLKLQANGVAAMFSDPLAKVMLSRFGGLESIAIFEISTRLVLGFRSLVVQLAQPLIPEFAATSHDFYRTANLLSRATQVAGVAALGIVLATLTAAPLCSVVMLGSIHWDLITMSAVLAVGYAVNALSIPHYYAGVGCNTMRWNIGSQFVMAMSVLLVGMFLGPSWGSYAIVFAILLGSVCGSITVVLGNASALRKPRCVLK